MPFDGGGDMHKDEDGAISEKNLIAGLYQRNRFVRLNAALALKGAQSSDAVQSLLKGLDDWYAPVRKACAERLAGSSDPGVLFALSQGTRDDDKDVRLACAFALERAIKKAA